MAWNTMLLSSPTGELRICGDYKVAVNKVSKLEQYPITSLEDLMTKLSGGGRCTTNWICHMRMLKLSWSRRVGSLLRLLEWTLPVYTVTIWCIKCTGNVSAHYGHHVPEGCLRWGIL